MFISKILTIVIPCKNEGENVIKCLSYLDNQYKIKNTRVIVVDSSDDGTDKSINPKKFQNISVEIIKGGNLSFSRNKGAELSRTSYVLFLDSNVLLRDVITIDECLKDIICYNMDLISIKLRTLSARHSYIYPMFEFFRDVFFNTPLIFGGFMMFNKEKFLNKGGFNEESNYFEDFEISMKFQHKKTLINNFIGYTSSDRFKEKGLFKLIWLAIKCYINKNNPSFFKK